MEVEQIREGFEETYKYSVGTHLAEDHSEAFADIWQ